MATAGPTFKELPVSAQPPYLRRKHEMGLSIIIAVFLIAIAIACAVAELYYNNLDLVARISLGFGSILASLLGAALVSFSTIKEQVRLEEQDQIGRVVAIAANNLNDYTDKLRRLVELWEQIATSADIAEEAKQAMTRYIEDFSNSTQSATDMVVNLNPDRMNPFNLSRFTNRAPCANNHCRKELRSDWLQPAPRSVFFMKCSDCSTINRLLRRSDGTIVSQFVRVEHQLVTEDMGRKQAGNSISIDCPNEACGHHFTTAVDTKFRVSKRPCPNCHKTVVINNASGELEIQEPTNNSAIVKDRMIFGGDGKPDYKCGCGAVIGVQYAELDAHNNVTLICRGCGAIHFDKNAILRSFYSAHLPEKLKKYAESKEVDADGSAQGTKELARPS